MERLHRSCIMEEIRHSPIPKKQETSQYKIISSPVGPLTLVANSVALLSLSWGEDLSIISDNFSLTSIGQGSPILHRAEDQLNEYFSGKRLAFDIPLEPKGTAFQKQVWHQLLKIPYGQHITYGEQARRIGRPKAARAVGASNGKNPIGIIIPCHRVIGASGHLTGFAGGLEIKRQLLDLEGAHSF